MAAAEARAAWQRTANRCFVQEDAKRAPKLACCQSSSSSSKQFDSGPNNPSDGPDHRVKGFMPLNNNSLFSTLPPHTRWWVQMQPDYGHQMGFSQEQLKALEIEIETAKSALNSAKMSKSDSICTNDHNKGDSSLHVCTKMAVEVQKREVNPLYGQAPQDFIDILDVKEGYELMDMDAFDCKPVTKHSNEFGIDLDSPWIRVEKTASCLRTTDIDDIVYLVSKKTHECIQNCDLPPAQKLCLRKYEHMPRPLVSKLNLKSQATTVCGQECVDSIVSQRKQEVLVGNSGNGSHKSFSCSNEKDNTGARQFLEGDTSKAELLEALRHSQTRAREAEKAAKQACAEKEHIVELFFKQASQLFAYRQWLRLLQFDQTFHNQRKDGDNPFSGEGRKRRKNSARQSGRRRGKHGQARDEMGKFAVAFAVGLSLVGAGLLLGWSVGWMLPPF